MIQQQRLLGALAEVQESEEMTAAASAPEEQSDYED